MAEEFKAAEVYVEFTTRGTAGVEQQIEQVNQKARSVPNRIATPSAQGKQTVEPTAKPKQSVEPTAKPKPKMEDGLFGSGGGGNFMAVAGKIGAGIGAAVSAYLATVKAGVSIASPQTMERLQYEMDRLLAVIGEHAIPLFEGLAKQTRKVADGLDYYMNSNDSWGKKLEAMFNGIPKSDKELNVGKWTSLTAMRDRLQEQALRGMGGTDTATPEKKAETALGKFVDALQNTTKKINETAPVLKWLMPPGINPLDPTGLGKFNDVSRMLNEG
jgi:hypothetical protein